MRKEMLNEILIFSETPSFKQLARTLLREEYHCQRCDRYSPSVMETYVYIPEGLSHFEKLCNKCYYEMEREV